MNKDMKTPNSIEELVEKIVDLRRGSMDDKQYRHSIEIALTKATDAKVEEIRSNVLSWVTEESNGLTNDQLSTLDEALTNK